MPHHSAPSIRYVRCCTAAEPHSICFVLLVSVSTLSLNPIQIDMHYRSPSCLCLPVYVMHLLCSARAVRSFPHIGHSESERRHRNIPILSLPSLRSWFQFFGEILMNEMTVLHHLGFLMVLHSVGHCVYCSFSLSLFSGSSLSTSITDTSLNSPRDLVLTGNNKGMKKLQIENRKAQMRWTALHWRNHIPPPKVTVFIELNREVRLMHTYQK